MSSIHNLPDVSFSSAASASNTPAWLALLSRVFGGKPVAESVVTRLRMKASAQMVWHAIKFYEEVPGKPSWLLRSFIPYPVRSEGKKSGPGAKVRCIYIGGNLTKQIIDINPPFRMQFRVLDQSLGIESCAIAQGGSYDLFPRLDGVDVVLTTNYLAHLHPRWLWRPIERLITHQLHLHILRGMRSDVRRWVVAIVRTQPPPAQTGGDECTTSQSVYRRLS